MEGVGITSIATRGFKFRGICSVGNKVIAAPWDADKLLIFDPDTKGVEGVDIARVAT